MDSQQAAIEKTEGPCAILAGPGTGKTTTLVRKVKFLVDGSYYKSSDILCLTFSNEATDNIRTKIIEQVKGGSEVAVRTFHAFCADVLREEGRFIGVNPDFEILEPNDAKIMFYKNFGVEAFVADRYVSTISTAKDLGISLGQIQDYARGLESSTLAQCPKGKTVEQYAGELEIELRTQHLEPAVTQAQREKLRKRKSEITAFMEEYDNFVQYRDFVSVWERYNSMKQERNYQDFSDLTVNALKLFAKHGSSTFSNRYKYIIVDEFQDTNKLQFELIEQLARDHRNLTVVGDQNQSIYGFRGAYREVFDHFKDAFKVNEASDVFHLDKSFRSPNAVLRTVHKLIQNNYEDPKEAFLVENADGVTGDNVQIVQLKNAAEEARKIAELVEGAIAAGTPLNEICVLFRTHRQAKLLREALESKDIPLATAGETNLMQRSEIRTVIAYLSIVNNLRMRTGTGEQAWWNLFHYHNALAPEDSVRIGRFLHSKGEDMSIDEALLTCLREVRISRDGERVVGRVVAKLRELVTQSSKALPELVLDVYEITGLNRRFTHKRTPRNVEALMNLRLFYEIAEDYWKLHERDLSGFIRYLEILEDVGVDIPASQLTDVNAVRFMTVHAVKGLEFDAVIFSNLAEGRFPITRTQREPLIPKHLLPGLKEHLASLGSLTEEKEREAIKEYERAVLLKEERRLCYVGMTRTKKKLILTYARSYNKEENSTTASVFLREIGYQNQTKPASWDDVDFEVDSEEKCSINSPNSEFEQLKSRLKDQLIESLDAADFPEILSRAITYHAVRDRNIPDYHKLVEEDWDQILDKEALEKRVAIGKTRTSGVKFDPKMLRFSPTALQTYETCPKKYELRQIFRMPERGDFDGDDSTSMGSFIHEVLQQGVGQGFSSEKEFVDLAREMSKEKAWTGVDLEDANKLLTVFWRRNSGTYDSRSMCEKELSVSLDGFHFYGIADRIDYLTNGGVRIVDYKTGRSNISPKDRATQLGFYAIGVREALGLTPKKLVLDFLRKDKPFEVELDGDKADAGRSKGFNLDVVRKELVETAQKIASDFESEFLPIVDDSPCFMCGYKFYCPKWEER